MRRSLVIHDFATASFGISLYMRKILFFISVIHPSICLFDNAWCRYTVNYVMSDSRHQSWNHPGMSLIKLIRAGSEMP
jgi:hypothetical protein